LSGSLDITTIRLFRPFNREVGKHRFKIFSQSQFEDYVLRTSGKDDVYVSVYTLDRILDRLVFDFDGSSAYSEARRVYAWCLEQGFPTIPTISGSKGFHLYVLFKPLTVENPKEFIMDKAVSVLNSALGVKRWDETSVDFHVVGNVSAMIRVPNTLRPPANVSYCSYLPKDWHLLSEEEVWHYSKYPHTVFYDMNPTKSLLDVGAPNPVSSASPIPVPKSETPQWRDYRYIDKLLLHPVSDGRHRISRFLLCPYFTNVLGYSDRDAYTVISMYLDACAHLRPTRAKDTLMYDITYARSRGFTPRSLAAIERWDRELYRIINEAIS
jgi:hypothetical protein